MKRSTKTPEEKQLTLKSLGALLNAQRPMTRLDRDAICLAVETIFKRVVALEDAHNADTKEVRETHILARLTDNALKRLRERVERSDSE